jgi:hypothetical protein
MKIDKQSRSEIEQAIQTLANRQITRSEMEMLLNNIVPERWPEINDAQSVSDFNAQENFSSPGIVYFAGTYAVLWIVRYFFS